MTTTQTLVCVGGDLDGHRVAVPFDEDGRPPATWTVALPLRIRTVDPILPESSDVVTEYSAQYRPSVICFTEEHRVGAHTDVETHRRHVLIPVATAKADEGRTVIEALIDGYGRRRPE